MVEGGCQKGKKGVELSDEKGSRYFKIRGGGGGGGKESFKENEEGWRKDAGGSGWGGGLGGGPLPGSGGPSQKKREGGKGAHFHSKTQMLPGSVSNVSWIYFQV